MVDPLGKSKMSLLNTRGTFDVGGATTTNKAKKKLNTEGDNVKLAQLRKFKKIIEDPGNVQTPFDLKGNPKYRKFKTACIIKQDRDRLAIIDFLISGLFRIYLLLGDKHFQEAFICIYENYSVCKLFNEFIVCSRHMLLLVLLLRKMEINDKAFTMLAYLRDLVEDTNNNKEAILCYDEIGKLYQEQKEYKMGIFAFKRMLQIAW